MTLRPTDPTVGMSVHRRLSLILGLGFLAINLVLMANPAPEPWWLYLENLVLAALYLLAASPNILKRPEIPLSWLSGWIAARMIDATLDTTRPLWFGLSHAIVILIAAAAAVLAWRDSQKGLEWRT